VALAESAMTSVLLEWLNLLARGAHVVAAIMWIGDSFLFMWLDSQLQRPRTPREGDVIGELEMAHGGGFYEVVKRRSLDALPPTLHTFKWESYTTWITGFLLLCIVYFGGGRAMLLGAESGLSQGAAIGLCLGALAVATVLYHGLCRTPLIGDVRAFGLVGLGLVGALTWGLCAVLTPRAAFLMTGATLGTIMSSNVLLVIIPAQREMVAATRERRPVDTSKGTRAKQRSTHNHYLTLPVLLAMLSNHFPSLYGHDLPWLVLALLCVVGVGVKVVMNARRRTPAVVWAGTAVALAAVVGMTLPLPAGGAGAAAAAGGPPVAFADVQRVVQTRCVSCHAAQPTDPNWAAPPAGVVLETPAQVAAQAPRILVRAVQTKTMPLGNLTGMTDDERALLGRWIAQGAEISAGAAP
jgi:uncharacterized membrane protein